MKQKLSLGQSGLLYSAVMINRPLRIVVYSRALSESGVSNCIITYTRIMRDVLRELGPTADAVLEITADPARLAEMSRSAHARASEILSPERIARGRSNYFGRLLRASLRANAFWLASMSS